MEGGESFLDPHSTLTRLIYSLIHTCISFIFPLSFQYFLNRQAFLRFPLFPLSLLLPLFTLANSSFSLPIFLPFFPFPLSYSLSLLLPLSSSVSFLFSAILPTFPPPFNDFQNIYQVSRFASSTSFFPLLAGFQSVFVSPPLFRSLTFRFVESQDLAWCLFS